MKLYRKDFKIYKDYISLLPAIFLSFNDPFYTEDNFSIQFRFLVFHARLLWLAESETKND